jgi:D-proline reductase (dithiol) PrdB
MTADATIRSHVSSMPAPAFDDTPATVAPPLEQATVAIVTTAGLKAAGEVELWSQSDASYTVIARGTRDVQLAHFSPNFDRSGFAADINVVYPIDRLEEMAANGTIGAVSDVHLSFMGAQPDATLSTTMLDTGPAAAKVLLDAGVDVVLLTPI